MSANNHWPLIQAVTQAFSLHYQETTQPVLNQHGFGGGDWLRTFIAYGLDPETVMMDLVQTIFPFATPAVNQAAFIAASEHGFLERLDENRFKLSQAGREGMTAFYRAAGDALANLTSLPGVEMNRLANLLQRIVKATETADFPTHKPRLLMSRKSDPGTEAAAPVRIDQYLTDLTNYRNDAHRVAWTALDVNGPAWEAFAYIIENGGQTAAAISEQFTERRGHSATEYAAALDTLVAQGWLSRDEASYTLTDKGQKVFDQVEETTNHTFYTGWQALTAEEQAELAAGLNNLNDQLRLAGMKHIWQLANGALGAAGPLYGDKTRAAMNEVGLNKPAYFITLWQGLGLEPSPISAPNFHRRAPYITLQALEERFENMATDGFLALTGSSGQYRITPAGREACLAVDNIFTAELSQIELLSENSLSQLVESLAGIVERSAAQEDETDKWNINTSRHSHRGDEVANQVKLDEYLDDLNAFRDDAHLAAYALHAPGLSGQALEAYTFLWRDGLNTAAALQERLAFRRHDETIFVAALRELVAQGWAVEEDGLFTLTEAGRTVREAVEQKTDDIFFAAWAELSNGQLVQILNRLLRLRRNLQALAGDKIAAERKELWPQAVAVGNALFQVVRQRTQAVREELGLNRPFAILAFLAARAHENGIVTAAKLRQRSPYVHPERMENYLQDLVETGHLRLGENGAARTYRITQKGRETIQTHLDTFWGEVSHLQPIPEANIERIAELLDRVVAATRQLTGPARPNFEAMQRLKAPENATALVRIDHAFDNLNAFRDDAHLATFQVSGHAWEALGDVWQSVADTAEAIAEQHPNRGYDTADYTNALSDLVKRGWLSETDGLYTLTERGQAVRDEAETLTDRYFYAPWAALNLDEIQELRHLLPQLEAGLQELAQPLPA